MMNLNMLFEKFDLLMDSPNSTAKMRELILQLAVQGKLVEQDPNDEPASELLKCIKAEKETLVKEVKIKKQKPLPPITEEEIPYALPDGWESIRIGDAINMINGRAFKPSEWNTVGLPIIRIQNLNNPVAPYNYCDFDVDPKFHLKNGDFLISWSGTPGTSFGAFVWDRGQAVLNQHIFRCELYGDGFFRPYLRLAINAQLDEMISQAHGGVGLQHITKGKLEKLVVTLPPFAEQKRIVAKVEQLMQLCDQLDDCREKASKKYTSLNDAALDKLLSAKTIDEFADHWQFICNNFDLIYDNSDHVNKLRQATLQLAVQGKLAPQDPNDEPASELLKRIKAEKEKLIAEGKIKKQKPLPDISEDEKPFELPDGWEWVRLGDLSILKGGFAYKSSVFSDSGNHQVIRMGNIRPDYLRLDERPVYIPADLAEETSEYQIELNNILITMTGTKGKRDYLYSLIVRPEHLEECKLYLNQRLCIVRGLLLVHEFLNMVINDDRLLDAIYEQSTGTANQANIGMVAISNWVLPLPPIEEQQRIVAKVDELLAFCDILKARLNDAQIAQVQLADAIVNQAVA